jgi:hypothetical protein
MQIFVTDGNEEYGPYSKEEVFALLKDGQWEGTILARTEEESEWIPVMEVLKKSAASKLFSLEEIVVQEQGFEPPKIFIEPSFRKSRPEFEDDCCTGGARKALFACTAMILAFVASFLWIRNVRDDGQRRAMEAATARQLSAGSSGAFVPTTPRVSLTPIPAGVFRTASNVAPGTALPTSTPVPTTATRFTPPTASLPTKPQDPSIVVRQVQLASFDGIEKSSLWVADTALQPSAILVVFLDPKDKAESTARDKEWQRFAQENNVALAAISLVPKEIRVNGKTVAALPNASQGFGGLLLSALDSAWGKPLPMIVYGRYGAGTFANAFAMWKPGRSLLWAAYTNEWKNALTEESSLIPGLIVCDRESTQHSSEAHDYFTRGRTCGRPWTWICLSTPWKERSTQIDRFFRDYARACLVARGNTTLGTWVSVLTHRPLSTLDLITKPIEAVWLPHAQLLPAWASLLASPVDPVSVTILQKSVATRNPKQPTLEMYLRIPGSKDKKAISGILAFCTWEKDQAAILSKLDIRATDKPVDLPGPAALVRSVILYAEEHQLAVLTSGTAEAWDKHVSTEEMEKEKQREFDRNFDFLANAWERGLKDLSREAGGIPTDNMLLYGMSRGAQWAHRLALRKPGYFLAVHVHIPSTFDTPTPGANKPLWLLTTGEKEIGYERAQNFFRECEALGYPIIFKAIVGLGHQGSSIADTLGLRFFDYALSVKSLRDNYEKQHIVALERLAKQKSEPWLGAFREPEYFGDFVNQDCVPIAQAEMIPKALRVALPNKILADAWNR